MDPQTIILFFFLFSLSAFFSGTEIALMSLPLHRIDSFIKEGKYGAKSLKRIKLNNERLLIAILISNNLVNVYTASLATQMAITLAEKSSLDQSLAIGLSTGIITFLILLFGEILPKTFASRNANKISLFVAKFYEIFIIILFPIIIFIEFIINLFKGKKESSLNKITEEEIEAFIDMGKDSGILETEEHEKIKNLLVFNDIDAEQIMTPRVDIEALEINTTVGDAISYIIEHTHSRIPIFIESIDKIEYVIDIRRLLVEKEKGNEAKILGDLNLDKIMKIPLTQPIDNILDTFKKAHKHISVVIDEYGGVSGLITLEDIIEEVFGDIQDESDVEIEDIKKINDNFYYFMSSVQIEDMLEVFDLKFEDLGLDEKEFSGETISYYITDKLERFPETGENIFIDIKKIDENDKEISQKIKIKVLEIKGGKIGKLEIKLENK